MTNAMTFLGRAWRSAVRSVQPLSVAEALDPGVPIILESFRKESSEGLKWEVVTDEAFGGSSGGHVELLQRPEGGALRFTGEMGPSQNSVGRRLRPFCAMKREFCENNMPVIDAGFYEKLEMQVRSDGREYLFSLKIASVNINDVYQG